MERSRSDGRSGQEARQQQPPQSEVWADEDEDSAGGGQKNDIPSHPPSSGHKIPRPTPHENPKHRKPSITFFASRLPPNCTRVMLLQAFGKYGNIIDASIAKKKDKRKDPFAFIRFTDVADKYVLEDLLNGVAVGGMYISVNLALYDRSGNKLEDPGVIPTPSTANPHSFPSSVPLNKTTRPGVSFKDALHGPKVKPSTMQSRIIINMVESVASLSWKGCSLIGTAWDVKSICNLKNLQFSPKLRYILGLNMMMTFKNMEEARSFLLTKDVWIDGFANVSPWIGQLLPVERVAWIRIHGVPIQLWDQSVFNMIGGKLGRVVQASLVTKDDDILSSDLIGIMVSHTKRINTELTVQWKNVVLQVWIEEETGDWIPDCLRSSGSNSDSTTDYQSDSGASTENSHTEDMDEPSENSLGFDDVRSDTDQTFFEDDSTEILSEKDGEKQDVPPPENDGYPTDDTQPDYVSDTIKDPLNDSDSTEPEPETTIVVSPERLNLRYVTSEHGNSKELNDIGNKTPPTQINDKVMPLDAPYFVDPINITTTRGSHNTPNKINETLVDIFGPNSAGSSPAEPNNLVLVPIFTNSLPTIDIVNPHPCPSFRAKRKHGRSPQPHPTTKANSISPSPKRSKLRKTSHTSTYKNLSNELIVSPFNTIPTPPLLNILGPPDQAPTSTPTPTPTPSHTPLAVNNTTPPRHQVNPIPPDPHLSTTEFRPSPNPIPPFIHCSSPQPPYSSDNPFYLVNESDATILMGSKLGFDMTGTEEEVKRIIAEELEAGASTHQYDQ
ncbi:hypothetical protein QVD17_41974 [Tagetes erecta]|uniref:RRM domain-containing protein n=1 Tax=Tagetes erecta TaxID=13708 RepID=A0AAD8JLA3_TARER|nr:hypothetical protein QVD17_41974 [Tagetes erecta]